MTAGKAGLRGSTGMYEYLATLEDAQVRHFLEAGLRETADILILVESAPVAPRQPKIVLVNDAFVRITGYTEEEVLGGTVDFMLGDPGSSDLHEQFRMAIEQCWPFQRRIRNLNKSGRPYWVDFRVTHFSMNGSEGPSHHLIRCIETTEQVESLDTIREQQKSLDHLLEVAGLGYWDLDLVKNTARRSAKHDQLFGHATPVPEHRWTYEFYASHVHPEDIDRVNDLYEAARASGEPFSHDYRIIKPDGEERWIWAAGRFLLDDNGVAQRAIGTVADVTEKKRQELEIQRLAMHDALTGLPNRRSFNESLKRAIASTSRRDEFAGLLFVDLDNFKRINDTLGHEVGDRVLFKVAVMLRDSLREVDELARFGGDEFVIILDNLSANQATAEATVQEVCNKIRNIFHRRLRVDDQELSVTVSIGVALFKGHALTTVDVLKQADIAMYQAKNSGKDTAYFFDATMEQHMLWRTSIEKGLRDALNQRHFHLRYQPKVNDAGQVVGYEALLRWEHLEKGMMPTSDFIGLAEETGLIIPIGRWVLEDACNTLRSWSRMPAFDGVSLSVNVSAVQFAAAGFVDGVLEILERTGAPRERLILEITEQTLMQNLEDSSHKIRALMAEKVSFSLDDFGTGYSSLYYLKTLPLREIKIDRSFTRDIFTDPNDEAIVSAVVSIAEKLDLVVVAEGVETAEQLRYLQNLRCRVFQGYYFAHPMSAEQAVRHQISQPREGGISDASA